MATTDLGHRGVTVCVLSGLPLRKVLLSHLPKDDWFVQALVHESTRMLL